MRSRQLWLVAAVGAAAFLLTAPAYGELKIGIVDIVQVMDNYERMKDANADVVAAAGAARQLARCGAWPDTGRTGRSPH